MSRTFNKLTKIFSPFREYFQNMLVVFSGSTFSELIPICVAPILTRIYLPEDFGIYGTIVSLAAVLSQLSTLRYENALVVSQSNHEVFCVWRLCEYLICFIHLIYFLATSFLFIFIFENFSDNNYFMWCILLPLLSCSSAFLQLQILLANREERFKFTFNIRVVTTSLVAILSISFGLCNLAVSGLIWPLILGNFTGAFLLRYSKTTTSVATPKDLIRVVKRYKNFLYYSLPGDLINNISSRYLLIVIPFMFDSIINGYLTLAYRIVGIPSRFVANAVAEIFVQYARKEMISKKNCLHLFLLTTSILFLIGFTGFFILFLYGEVVFEIFFGHQWKATGGYVKTLIPLFLISFIVSPLSSMIYLSEKQHWDLFWKIGYLLMIIASTSGVWFVIGDIQTVLMSFVVAASSAYVVYFWMLFVLSKGARDCSVLENTEVQKS